MSTTRLASWLWQQLRESREFSAELRVEVEKLIRWHEEDAAEIQRLMKSLEDAIVDAARWKSYHAALSDRTAKESQELRELKEGRS